MYRLVVDEWLEIAFNDESSGQEVMTIVQTLRSMWSHILELKLENCKGWQKLS